MVKPPVIKYYTFTDDTNIHVTEEFCEQNIKQILKTYSRMALISTLSEVSQKLGANNDPQIIKALQERYLNIPVSQNIFLVHRQAILVLFQFIFSLSEHDFSICNSIKSRDIILLFELTNSYLEIFDYVKVNKSLRKKIFFSSIKTVHIMMNKNDLQASSYYYDKYTQAIEDLSLISFNDTIKDYFGEDISSIRKILEDIKNRNYPELFSFLDNFAVIDYDKIDTYWENRSPKFMIPFEYNLFSQYPLIKKGTNYFISDVFNLFNSIFTIVYEILVEEHSEKFKSVFGKDIAETVVTNYCKEVFDHDQITFIRVGSKSKEYADIGILYRDCIFLFEVKTSFFSRKMIYSPDYNKFIKAFNNKYVLKEGISQQIKQLINIENNFDTFCELSSIDKSIHYTIYPILLVFDEALQAFCANWYLSTRFDNLKRVNNFIPTKYSLAKNHSTITFNEIFRLDQLNITLTEKLDLIKQYSDSTDKQPMSLTLFIQQTREDIN